MYYNEDQVKAFPVFDKKLVIGWQWFDFMSEKSVYKEKEYAVKVHLPDKLSTLLLKAAVNGSFNTTELNNVADLISNQMSSILQGPDFYDKEKFKIKYDYCCRIMLEVSNGIYYVYHNVYDKRNSWENTTRGLCSKSKLNEL